MADTQYQDDTDHLAEFLEAIELYREERQKTMTLESKQNEQTTALTAGERVAFYNQRDRKNLAMLVVATQAMLLGSNGTFDRCRAALSQDAR